MKKYAILCVLTLIAFAQTSCIIRNDTPAPDCKYNAKTVYLEVKQNEWKFDSQNQQFYTRFDVPEITADIYNYGNYSLHREYNTGLNTAYQVALPQSILCMETVTNGNTTTDVYYTQLVDYILGVGYVEIQVTNSDFFYPEDKQGYLINPEAMVFHLQLIY